MYTDIDLAAVHGFFLSGGVLRLENPQLEYRAAIELIREAGMTIGFNPEKYADRKWKYLSCGPVGIAEDVIHYGSSPLRQRAEIVNYSDIAARFPLEEDTASEKLPALSELYGWISAP